MAWFHKKKTEAPHVTFKEEQILELREYVDLRLDEYRMDQRRLEKEQKERGEIRYSIRDESYDNTGIINMRKFMSDARQDAAMFNHPALQKTYHNWERQAAVRKTFSSEIMRLLNERGIRPSDFYKEAGIDKRVFHSMKADYMYKPSKETAFRCCAGLHLSYEDTSDLLKLAGYSLSPSDSRELVLRFCLENQIFDMYSINCLLNAMGEKEFR